MDLCLIGVLDMSLQVMHKAIYRYKNNYSALILTGLIPTLIHTFSLADSSILD